MNIKHSFRSGASSALRLLIFFYWLVLQCTAKFESQDVIDYVVAALKVAIIYYLLPSEASEV